MHMTLEIKHYCFTVIAYIPTYTRNCCTGVDACPE